MEVDLSLIFKSMVWDLLIKQAIADALAWLPLSISGPFGIVIGKAIGWLGDKLFTYFITVVKIEDISLMNSIHDKMYKNAQLKLKIIAKESGVDSQEFKNENAKMQDALWDFVRFNADPLKLHIGKN